MKNIPLRKIIGHVEFDYQTLVEALKGYSRPRTKISALLRKGTIIRVKKGLYVLGEEERSQPVCRELLANLIYGPSYISFEFALFYYGLIPERAEMITSVCLGRSRTFDTPVGYFSYRMTPLESFRAGMDRIASDDDRAFLMATAEKALADTLISDRSAAISTQRDLLDYLLNHLRIAPESLRRLNHDRLLDISARCRSRRVRLLAAVVSSLQKAAAGVSNA
ncbi:MAG: hypothetical protein J0665_00150 [Deltaproteobacteria bacterium]|jgi:hypothetical protein|nr:hypothetical protein [Deltaproteobacteria bacterium]